MYNDNTDGFSFSWDKAKADTNFAKHSVTLEEACTVFFDAHARVIFDEAHAFEEDRCVLLGLGSRGRLLVACHTVHEREGVIRIISARRATPREEEAYRRYRHAD